MRDTSFAFAAMAAVVVFVGGAACAQCGTPITAPGSWQGNTCGAGNDCSLRPSEDVQFEVTIDQAGEWTFSLCGATWDTWMALGETCCTIGGEGTWWCDDHMDCGAASEFTVPSLPPGVYHLTVEGSTQSWCGPFVLEIFETIPQPPDYRVTDLGELDMTPDPFQHGTFGINNAGQVVFYYFDANDSKIHPALWLPEDAYGLSAGPRIDLSTLTIPAAPLPGLALEINDSGEIAGQVGGDEVAEGEAAVWKLATGSLLQLGFLDPVSRWSRAVAIDNGSPATVVGESEVLDDCRRNCELGGPPVSVYQLRSFHAVLNSPTPTLLELAAMPDCDHGSFVRDVALVGGASRITGFSDELMLEMGPMECVDPTGDPCGGGARRRELGAAWHCGR